MSGQKVAASTTINTIKIAYYRSWVIENSTKLDIYFYPVIGAHDKILHGIFFLRRWVS